MDNEKRLSKMNAKLIVLRIFKILPDETALKLSKSILMAQMANDLGGDISVVQKFISNNDPLLDEGLEVISDNLLKLGSSSAKPFFDNLMDPEKSFEDVAAEAVAELSPEQFESMKEYLPGGVLETLGIRAPKEKEKLH